MQAHNQACGRRMVNYILKVKNYLPILFRYLLFLLNYNKEC